MNASNRLRRPLLALLVLPLLAAGHLSAQEKSADITVPAGGELVRSIDAAQVSVHLVTRPFFSQSSLEVPVLEVGPSGLSFVRADAGGGLVLFGDQTRALPGLIALAEDGRSRETLDFTFTFSQPLATATLEYGGQKHTVAATASAGPVQVVVGAGLAQPWPLQTFAISTAGAGTASADTATTTTTGAADGEGTLSPAVLGQRRIRLAAAVADGSLTPSQALAELKLEPPRKTAYSSEADLAFAAICVGESLVGMSHFEEAEVFFRAAEPALVAFGQSAGQSLARAQTLKQLAWIRTHYLNQAEQARTDIAKAYELSPNDQNLQQLYKRLTGQPPIR